MATKQDVAVAKANELINTLGLLKQIRSAMNDFLTQYNGEAYNTTWAALATAPQNTNGTLGTPDGSPVPANPIDTRVAGQALSKAVSSNQLVQGVVLLQNLQKFLTNVLPTQGNYNQSLDDLAS